MPKIRYLCIQFDAPVLPREVPCFRAAVIERTRRASSLFHNHRNPDGYHYRYPLIQYKTIQGKAGIVCLNDGADDIHHLLQHRDLTLQIGDRRATFRIEDVRLNYFNVQVWQTYFHYSLHHWIALNQDNYRRFQALDSEVERLQLLERILTGNLMAFAKYIDWTVEDRIEVRITKLKRIRYLPYKGQKVLAFSLNFRCNVSLPDWVGIGKGASTGFGTVKQLFGSRKAESGKRKAESHRRAPHRRAASRRTPTPAGDRQDRAGAQGAAPRHPE